MSPVERAFLRIRHRGARHRVRRFRLVTEPRISGVRRAYAEMAYAENELRAMWGDR